MTAEDDVAEHNSTETDPAELSEDDAASATPASDSTTTSTTDSQPDDASDSSDEPESSSDEPESSSIESETDSDEPETDSDETLSGSAETGSTDEPGPASDATIAAEPSRVTPNAEAPSRTSRTRERVLAATSASEKATLKRVRAVSKLLDEAFRIPGTNYRVGIDPLFGIIPVAGDAIPTALSLYPVVEAYRFGVPKSMLAKMLALVAIDAVVGSIPVIGTIFDAVWKANKWNLGMLERHIEQRSTDA